MILRTTFRRCLAPLALIGAAACAPNSAAQREQQAGPAPAASILAWSKPAAGSSVNGPVHELVLHFSPPARLVEVTVAGPDGAMPMMVTAAGEAEHYALPLPGLEPGRYSVEWRATVGGADHRGRFAFQVR